MLTEIPLHISSVRAVAEINGILREHKMKQQTSRGRTASTPDRGLMQSIQAAGHQAAIEDGVIKHNYTPNAAETVVPPEATSSAATGQTQALRRGKWTAEEEEYSNRLIVEFKNGTLPLTDGTTLRTFLSKLLNCDPMRISKKFVGNNSIGKQIFRRDYFDGVDQDQIDLRMEQTKRELAELERRFLEKVAETNMKMCTKYEDIQEFGSSEASPGRGASGFGTSMLPSLSRELIEQRPWMMAPLTTSSGGDGASGNWNTIASVSSMAAPRGSPAPSGSFKSAHDGYNHATGASAPKRESTAMAPAVTMPFTLAQMHAAAEQNGILAKTKKRSRHRRRSNSSVSASSDVSSGGGANGIKRSPRRNVDINAEFQVPTHPMYSSFGSDWLSSGHHDPSPHDSRLGYHKGHKMNTPQYEDNGGGGSGMKRVSSLDLLCSASMGHGDIGEWGFGNGLQDWSNLAHSSGKGGGGDSQRKRFRARGGSFGNASDVSDDGLRYDEGGQNITQSDSTADLMSLLGQVPHSRNSLGSNTNMAEEYSHEGTTPFSSAGLNIFAGNRTRTVSGQSYDGSDFGLSYSPRASYPENDFGAGKDVNRGLHIPGSAVFNTEDSMPMDSYGSGVDVSPMNLPQGNSEIRTTATAETDFMWSNDFVAENGDIARRRTTSGDRIQRH